MKQTFKIAPLICGAILLLMLVTSCKLQPQDIPSATEDITPVVSTPVDTSLTEAVPAETTPQETTPKETVPLATTPEITTPAQPPHEHLFGEETLTKEPTCVQNGTKIAYCSCGESLETDVPATGRHDYQDNVCVWCQKTELELIPVSSKYDADGDGQKDTYYFSADIAQRCFNGIWLWAGNYDKTLSGAVSKASAAGIEHWYIERGTDQRLTYRITVPENGVYEMILHMRLKDGNERGAKYIFNAGTSIEQIFETSHAFDATALGQAQNETIGTYMYGIRVYLQGGENIFSIVSTTQSPNSQHFREFYFVWIAQEHTHNFVPTAIIKQPTCNTTGQKTLVCECGESQTVSIPKLGEHNFQNGFCEICGEADIPLFASKSDYDADGNGEKDTYYFSPKLSNAAKEGTHLWAGYYNATLSTNVNTVVTSGISHWYVDADGSGYLVYSVTVPEDGIYEMILHMRLKDGAERGAKYIFNEGTTFEQVFETSHAFDAQTLESARNDTVGTYMYGIRVNLVAGTNTIKITAASSSPKTQHFRDFYFVKIGEFHEHAYLLKSVVSAPTCMLDGEVRFTCSCGDSRTVLLPATQKHTYVDEICTVCGQKDLGIGIVAYDFISDKAGFAGGTVSLVPEVSGSYTLYWADENGKLSSYTALGSFAAAAGKATTYTVHQNTAIPEGATRLIAVSAEYQYTYVIPQERLLTSQKLYTFGAISDTHQGTRYGPESLSYERLVNAGRILSEKNAVLVGINGDITYINLESEYILHADAVKEIFEFAPDMPVFTTAGNHESRDPYPFDKERYLQYTRNLADYDSDLTYVYSDGNDLDYVIELPDGSVIIFLHQIYYDYNKAESRLMDDSQLDWLGARLEQYKDRTVFLFFHSPMQGKVGDFDDYDDGLNMCTYTEDYKRLDAYFQQYTNVIFFNGHSHGSFDAVLGGEYSDRVINEYNGEYATLVHIPSLGQSQLGYIVHVYEDRIVFEGYDFGNDQAIAYATFIIEK